MGYSMRNVEQGSDNIAEARAWIEQHLDLKDWRGDEAEVHCPLSQHTDAHASASANPVNRTWYCHGCDVGDTLSSLAETLGVEPPPWHAANSANGSTTNSAAPPPAAPFPYCDERGEKVFEVVRLYGIVWKVPPAGRGLPYRLPELSGIPASGKPLIIVEGEKDADRLAELGFAATCNAGGAGKWTAAHSRRLPRGLNTVVLLGDADVPGMQHLEKTGDSLLKYARVEQVLVVLPEAMGFELQDTGGKDVSDWLDEEQDRGSEDVERLLAEAVPFDGIQWPEASVDAGDPAASGQRSVADDRPEIVATPGDRLSWTREAIDVLVRVPDDEHALYESPVRSSSTGASAGMLTSLRRIQLPKNYDWLERPEGSLWIDMAKDSDVETRLDMYTRWLRPTKKELVPVDPSGAISKAIQARYKADTVDGSRPRLRVLEGIVDSPTMRRDGSLITKPGYDPESGLFADFDARNWKPDLLPKKPSRFDAMTAAHTLLDVVRESQFAGPLDSAIWLALVLTIVGRVYVTGNIPLFGLTANHRGAGKGTLADLATIIATGLAPAKWAPISGRKAEDAADEERKRLISVALAGLRVLCIDNVEPGQAVGSSALEGALTNGGDSTPGTISDRILGESRTSGTVPWRTVVIATGNNLTFRGDMPRRAVLCKLLTKEMEPELHQYKLHPDPQRYVRQARPELLAAVLTILSAHHHALESAGAAAEGTAEQVARGEAVVIRPWVNSYGRWSDCVRSAIVWALGDAALDPWLGNAAVKAEAVPEQAEAMAFLKAWHDMFGSREVTTAAIDAACETEDDSENVKAAALEEAVRHISLAPAQRKDVAINRRSLGFWCGRRCDEPGPWVLRKGKRERTWFVEPGPKLAQSPEPTPAAQAIRDLLADFPDDFVFQGVTLGRRALYDCLLQLSKDRLLSLRYVYQDGHHLAEHLQKYETTRISVDPMRKVYRDRAKWLLSLSIHFLACEANHKRPAGLAYEQAKDRFESMAKTTTREESALSLLLDAARQLDSAEENAEVLAQKAIELSVEGSDSTQKQKWDRWFDADVEAAIKELLGLKEPSEERDYLGAASWPQAMFNMLVEKAKQVRQNRESGKGHYNRMTREPLYDMLMDLVRLEMAARKPSTIEDISDADWERLKSAPFSPKFTT